MNYVNAAKFIELQIDVQLFVFITDGLGEILMFKLFLTLFSESVFLLYSIHVSNLKAEMEQ